MAHPTGKQSERFPLSYSRANTFKTCPAQFEHLYITKDVSFQGSDAMDYGNRVHGQLEKYGKTGDVSQLTRESRQWKGLVDQILLTKGEKHFEKKLGLTADLKKCGWFAKDIWLRGIFDVLVLDGDTAYVIDWKTGKVREDMTQLKMFAGFVMHAYPQIKTVNAVFMWLVHEQTTEAVYKREHLDLLWASIDKQLGKVQEAIDLGVFVAKPSPLCNWCAAKTICKYR
jgi:hypothetical protein